MPVEKSFPEPLRCEPSSGIHKHTIIFLHGRGGSADTFGPALLGTTFLGADATSDSTQHGCTEVSVQPAQYNSCPTTLVQVFPHARFVFPAAPKLRATVYKRSIIRQWFDDWHLGFTADRVDSRYDLGLQTTGLGSTVAYLHDLITEEAELVGGTRNVVLGGISQGCVASLVASLLWEGTNGLGGVAGMCGWLPYISQMREQLLGGDVSEARDFAVEKCHDEEEAGFDPFDRSAPTCSGGASADETDGEGSVEATLKWLRDEIEVPARRAVSSSAPISSTPVMLCHGQADEKVAIAKARETTEFLTTISMGPLRFKEYAGVEHDFSSQMISDIAGFLQDVLGQTSN
ncbi:hypothetical protein Daus18300_004234 [Diaporthe australafricana]|uniref:Phospholipase/carboxylesterase/thioesterase domain-containing protein n=1 Tax=Diaporthe australafricana TaxID=127596 RepID=A0ABR3X9P4_9PEZI